jgi:uncharacterized protein (TIGR02452 family)
MASFQTYDTCHSFWLPYFSFRQLQQYITSDFALTEQIFEAQRQWGYPLPEFGGLYTPNALVFRSAESSGYEYLRHPKRVSFIAVAAYRDPPLQDVNGEMLISSNKVINNTKKKISTILNMALEHGHDCVVLSALGCGAYGSL